MYNVFRQNVNLTGGQLSILRRFRPLIYYLMNKRNSDAQVKRQLASEQTGGFLPALLAPILGGLIGGLIG